MNFRFQIGKATEASCELLQRAGGQLNIMKLVKLLYLLDRLSIDRRNIPVVGGDYLSMRNGPVTSEVLDLINSGRLFGDPDTRWDECVSDRRPSGRCAREAFWNGPATAVEARANRHGSDDV